MLVDEFIDYLRYERNYSDYTLKAYNDDLLQFVSYINESDANISFPEEIDSDIIRNWEISLLEKGISSASVKRKLSSLKSFFKYLIRRKCITSDPSRLIKSPKVKKVLPYFVKDKDMEYVLDCNYEENEGEELTNIRNQLIIEMLYDTGMRRSELVNLRDADVDYERSQIKVLGKRNKQRLIPFAPKLKDLMLRYQSVRNNEEGKSEWFFTKKGGRQINVVDVYRAVRDKLSVLSSLSKRSPHILRHSFATSMLNNGAELNAVKDLLGHSSLASTGVYTHTSFEELKKVYHAHPRAKKEGGFYGN